MLIDGSYKTVLAEPISRGGGPADYFAVTEDQRFEMRRPGVAQVTLTHRRLWRLSLSRWEREGGAKRRKGEG